MKQKILSLFLAVLLMLSCAALAEETPAAVVDGMGRSVEIPAQPQTVVSLSPANTEILFALGAGDKVVGVDASSDYPAEALEIDKVGDYSGPNLEAIVALKPDVVFASTTLQTEIIDQLTELGVTVVCNEPTAYADIASGIQLVADVMGLDASELLASMEAAKAAALEKAVSGESKPKVYFALSFGEYGDWSAGSGTFIDDMITLAGGVNVAASSTEAWPMYSIEQLVADDPDVILVSDFMGDGSLIEALKNTDGYKDLRCVKEGRVYAVDANTSSRPAPRINEALEQIVAALNG